MEIEPVTRKEMFMAAAAGENVTALTPVTREEYFLSKIAGSGGGGGGGTDDVYTVKQITHYGTGETELQGDYAGAKAAHQSGKKLKFVEAFNFNGQERVLAESFSYTFSETGGLIFVVYYNYNFVTYELTESGVTYSGGDTHIGSLYVETPRSLVLKSASGKLFRVIVSDTGDLSTEEIT